MFLEFNCSTLELKDHCWVPFCVFIVTEVELLSMPALKKICPQCFANVNVRRSLHVIVAYTQMQSFSGCSQRIAMKSMGALETIHEIKCRQEQNQANIQVCPFSFVWAVRAMLLHLFTHRSSKINSFNFLNFICSKICLGFSTLVLLYYKVILR